MPNLATTRQSATRWSTFDPKDPATWPVELRTREIAAIFGYSYEHVRRQAYRGAFQPAPRFHEGRSPRWLRGDLIAYLEGR